MKTATVEALVKIVNYDAPFFASDLGIAGGTINALVYTYGLLKPTGREKAEFILIDDNEDIYKKITSQEWVLNTNNAKSLYKETCKKMDTLFLEKQILERIL